VPTKTDLDPQVPTGLEYKAALASPESGLIDADDATGVVEAIVSVTGVLDEDRDVIKPGSYAKTLAKRRPKGIFVHDWSKWVARTEEIAELMPGDPRLPKQTKNGRPWPSEAGGLYVKARFNLDTPEGKAAYSNVKFFSETGECEWSIGYKVPPGKSVRTKSGERHIEEVDLFEYSPVLFGANVMSGTLSVKSAATPEAEERIDELTGDDESKELFDLSPPSLSQRMELFKEIRSLQVPDISDATARDRAQAALFRLDQALARGKISEAEAQLKIVLSTFRNVDRNPMIRSFTENALRILSSGGYDVERWRGPGATEHRKAADEPNEAKSHDEALEVEEEFATAILEALEDLDGLTWEGREGEGEEKGSRASLDSSPKKNWVENAGELPGYIREIARSIHEKRGMPLEQAIPIAIAQVKRWAAGGGDVEPDTRAKAAAAVAEWEALKAKNQASRKGFEVEGEEKAQGEDVLESSTYPFLPGTYEELREQLREQATKTLSSLSAGLAHVEVMGTWPSSTVVTAYHANGKASSYEIPYTITMGNEDTLETVKLDEPVPVELKVSVDGIEEDAENLLPYPSVLEDVTNDLKAILGSGVENKAGRVLSAVNEKRLLAAVESLVAVLKAAGLEVNANERVKEAEEEEHRMRDALQYQDSTAPSARGEGKMLLNPELLARGYRLIGEAYTR
jgi:phage head maturation protease